MSVVLFTSIQWTIRATTMQETYPVVGAGIAVLESARTQLASNLELVVCDLTVEIGVHKERVEVDSVDGLLLDRDHGFD